MIRAYANGDLAHTARVWLRSGQAEYDYLSAFQELDEQKAIDVFRRIIQDNCTIWVYEVSDEIVAFMAMDNNFIDRLYVAPEQQGIGIGSKFIDHAKKHYPNGLNLRTHQKNNRARAFYERRGFRVIGYGVSPPPESMPDMEYHWAADEVVKEHDAD